MFGSCFLISKEFERLQDTNEGYEPSNGREGATGSRLPRILLGLAHFLFEIVTCWLFSECQPAQESHHLTKATRNINVLFVKTH